MLEALKAGKSLENPEFWKSIQNLLNFIAGSSAFIVMLFPVVKDYLTTENIMAVSGFVAAANAYFTTATTKKIGV
jgi:hypothetical protein